VTFIANRDLMLEIPAGNIPGKTSVNKFGRSTNVDNGVATDIWDRANATDNQAIWVAPTAARLHDIDSTDAFQDINAIGNGAWQVKIFGLTGWGATEVNETINLNGTAKVTTANSYVIIHRMIVIANGGTQINGGTIKATAQTDGTVTAQINIGEGQTQMAIYGIPSTETWYMTCYYSSLNKATAASNETDIKLLVNEYADTQLVPFATKHTLSLSGDGTSYFNHCFEPYFKITGPAIIKVQGSGSANNQDVSAGFDVIRVTN